MTRPATKYRSATARKLSPEQLRQKIQRFLERKRNRTSSLPDGNTNAPAQNTPSHPESGEENGVPSPILATEIKTEWTTASHPRDVPLNVESLASYLTMTPEEIEAGVCAYAALQNVDCDAEAKLAYLTLIRDAVEAVWWQLGHRPALLFWLNLPDPQLEDDPPRTLIEVGEAKVLLDIEQSLREGGYL